MDLNAFATSLLAVLGRIADAAEGAAGAAPKAPAKTTEKAPAKTTEKAPTKTTKAAKPTNDRDAVKAILIKVKDTISKEAAQEVFKAYGYEAMSAIEEKDFDAIFADATARLEAEEDGGEDDI